MPERGIAAYGETSAPAGSFTGMLLLISSIPKERESIREQKIRTNPVIRGMFRLLLTKSIRLSIPQHHPATSTPMSSMIPSPYPTPLPFLLLANIPLPVHQAMMEKK